MPDPTLDRLIAATRRRLWWEQCRVAVGRAAWGSAGALLLAAAWHLALGPVALPLWGALLAAGWAAAGAWAALQRPSDAACALWADRHLGGASAFSTWLDLQRDRSQAADARAVAWLRRWAADRVPPALHLLAQRQPAAGLARPLLALAVCAGLLAAVAALSPPSAPRRPAPPGLAAAPPGSASMDRLAAASAPALQDLAGELAKALRSPPPQGAPRGAPSQAGATGESATAPGASAATRPASDPPAGRIAPARTPPATGEGVQASSPLGAPSASGATAGTGHGAGRSADDSSASERGRALAPAGPVRDVPLAAASAPPQRQADMTQGATYDEFQPVRRTEASALPSAAPATAPPAERDARLTPTEASYVQAWMKAITRSSR